MFDTPRATDCGHTRALNGRQHPRNAPKFQEAHRTNDLTESRA